ncbi:hypothetical protein [Saccharibacillus sp. JS10]|uniref:hypothetical protein n=1 Tax=Saccharibacillus sp. JS10 TaxID=2950552 RepID=UPI00210E7CF4|nr:hypothetical protein [Saccharibacillus sp. JS10]MCQ4085714.1 hypothetical protein [Saccharibacillus sp. JS10]
MDRQLNSCLDHLWTRPRSTTNELQQATGVALTQLHDFIKSGRLSASSYSNLTYPCESCGQDTRSGRLCHSCLGVFREAGKATAPVPVRQVMVKTASKTMYTSRNR